MRATKKSLSAQALSYVGFIEVHWGVLIGAGKNFMDTNSDGKIDDAPWHTVKDEIAPQATATATSRAPRLKVKPRPPPRLLAAGCWLLCLPPHPLFTMSPPHHACRAACRVPCSRGSARPRLRRLSRPRPATRRNPIQARAIKKEKKGRRKVLPWQNAFRS